MAVALPQSFAFPYRSVTATGATAGIPEVQGIPAAVVFPQVSSRKYYMTLVEETQRTPSCWRERQLLA
ncbi:MAG TPA: hypothetical protein IGR15_01415 [Synechococcus sp. M44_DOE_062]|nr:hypothetical protein [Synechococcus sp. M44_DOE_062]